MTKEEPRRVDPLRLRDETREWLSTRTIPNVRAIAKDLENAGEDVRDLLAAIRDLESILNGRPAKGRSRKTAKGPG